MWFAILYTMINEHLFNGMALEKCSGETQERNSKQKRKNSQRTQRALMTGITSHVE